MFKRMFFLTIMMSAVGIPYLLTSSSEFLKSVGLPTLGGNSDPKAKTPNKAEAAAGSPKQGLGELEAPASAKNVEGYAVTDLAEILQFNGTPGWVMAHWPRVTAGLAELDLQGYRVPLVTGTSEGDLAGSLTYYFDKKQQVAYITFHGTTGDPRKLISLVMSRYDFKQETVNDPGLHLYQAKWSGKPQSELRIRPARLVRANQPHTRYEVDLAMKRPK